MSGYYVCVYVCMCEGIVICNIEWQESGRGSIVMS